MRKVGVGLFSAEAFDIFGYSEHLESCGGFSWRDPLEEPDDLSECDPETRMDVYAVLGVTVGSCFPFFCGD